MIDNSIMLFILLFLACDVLLGIRFEVGNKGFFDLKNTQAMRGFWCLVVILVHVPEMYQNRIQDMIGSFAYIGVTFFFMTSSYGLTISQDIKPEGIKTFWRKRLLKILVVSWICNLLSKLVNLILLNKAFTIMNILMVGSWIKWLLACYFAFWISNIVLKKPILWKIATICLVVIGSFIMYYLKHTGMVGTTWETECYGFIWGILLASFDRGFKSAFLKKWWIKLVFSAVVAFVLGTTYIKFKVVPFAGDYILKFVLGLSIILFILIANLRIEFGNKVSLFLGSISFEIYLIHGSVFEVLKSIRIWNSSGLFILTSIILTIIIAELVHELAERCVKEVKKLSLFCDYS